MNIGDHLPKYIDYLKWFDINDGYEYASGIRIFLNIGMCFKYLNMFQIFEHV